jgi:hypothetical protein
VLPVLPREIIIAGESAPVVHDRLDRLRLVAEACSNCLRAWPLAGDATLDGAVEEFTKEARELGASRAIIVQSDETRLWWILPPISFIITPAWTNVAGDALP